ncbi:MAG: hypothetical protein ACJ8LG_03765 [Massilia sp.]
MTNGETSTAASGGPPPNGNIEKRLAAVEAVLPTLATKADIVELRSEMSVQNEKLRAEMSVQNEKLRAEMSMQNEGLRAEMLVQHERLRGEMQRLVAAFYKWMIVTMLTILIAFAALGNVLIARLPVPGPARTSTAMRDAMAPANNTSQPHLPVTLLAGTK